MSKKREIPAEVSELIKSLSEPGEEWARHPKYTSYYGSSLGRVLSVPSNPNRAKLLSYTRKVELISGSKGNDYSRRQYVVYRFIWECFHGLIQDNRQMVFLDGDKTNVKLNNLKLVKPAERIRAELQRKESV